MRKIKTPSDAIIQMRVNQFIDFLSLEWQKLSPEQIKMIYAATRQAYYSIQTEHEWNQKVYG